MPSWIDNDTDAHFSFEDSDYEEGHTDKDLDETEDFDWLTDDLMDYLFPKVQ